MFLLLSYLLAPGAAVAKPAAPKASGKPPPVPPGAPGGKLPPRTLYFFY